MGKMKMNSASSIIRRSHARQWIEKGAEIVPLARRGKEPLSGYSSKRTLRSVIEVKTFLSENPEANYGIVTGLASGLVVLDVDGEEGLASLLTLSEGNPPLPNTVKVRTGRGVHFFFRHTGLPIPGRIGHLGSGLDIRAEGNYVVGPGSIHGNGTVYAYEPDSHLFKTEIAALPEWLFRLMLARKPAETAVNGNTRIVGEGSRNAHLTSLAGKLHNTGMNEAALLSALFTENTAICHPPLSEIEVTAIARSIGRYSIVGAGKDAAEAIAQAILDHEFAAGEHLIYAADGQFWAYKRTAWSPISGNSLRGIALRRAKTMETQRSNTASLLAQVETILKAQVSADEDKLRFLSQPPPVVNCRNGEVWLSADGTPELRPHSAGSYLRHCLDVDYASTASCPQFDGALAEIFSNAASPPAMIKFWHELAGYIIQPDRQIPLIVICRGEGSNGKTTLVDTLMRLLGQDLVAALRVQDLNRNQFSTGNLLGKLLFVDDDVKMGTRLPDGDLKRLSEAKVISAERKFGAAFNFVVRTIPMLLCNNPPSLADLSEGMRRRLVVVPFDRTFSKKEIDRSLFPSIWATELPGILNQALAGWQRVVKRGHKFWYPSEISAAKEKWLLSANPVPGFLDEKCIRQGQCATRVLYSAFRTWSAEMGFTLTQQQTSFKRNLESLGFAFKHGNEGDVVIGISLNANTQIAAPGQWVGSGRR